MPSVVPVRQRYSFAGKYIQAEEKHWHSGISLDAVHGHLAMLYRVCLMRKLSDIPTGQM
jgi:hypothetical protein